MFIRTKYESLHSVIRQLNVFVLLSSPDKWKHCGVWRSASLCSVYYPPERLSSSCFPRFPSPSSFLSLSRSLRTLKGLHEFQSDSISASKLLHLFSVSQKKISFSLSEPLCWPPPDFPPSLHLFPPTFNGSLTSIFTVSCCSGQRFFINCTALWMVFHSN